MSTLFSQDLRARLGVILALALLPILVFSIWEAYNDYNKEVLMQNQLLEDVANNAVNDIVGIVRTTKFIMKIAASTTSIEECKNDVTRILENFPRMYNMVVSEPDGTINCTGREIRSYDSIRDAAKDVTITRPFYIDLPEVEASETGPEGVIVMTYGQYVGDELDRVVLTGFDVSVLNRMRERSDLPKDTKISLLSPNGKLLLGDLSVEDTVRRDWIFQARDGKKHESAYVNQLGDKQHVDIFNADGSDLFIVISAPEKSLLSQNKLKPLISLAIPLFAWLFGFVAIWLSTDRLLLVHLRQMRANMLKFARGQTEIRVGKLQDAPDTITELGRAYDRMADTVVKREGELRVSLDEKETLLREIHHRVKNNLQIVISLLNIQERKLKSKSALAAIRESRNRINAISLVHKELYESEDITLIEMSKFITQITTNLRRALLANNEKVNVVLDINCRALDSDRATPLALFIVEAFTNSVKHGVPYGGQIDISVEDVDDQITVRIIDNGKCLSRGVEISDEVELGSDSTGMGNRLMSGFARQLSGQYAAKITDEGYETTLSFPVV